MKPRGAQPGVELTWCRLCGSQHDPAKVCPRGLFSSDREDRGWRIAVETEHGVKGFGVLLAPAGSRWRSRIVTFPNVLWMVPGGGETMKFLARTREQAERLAKDFIRRHCVLKGYTMRDELQFVRDPDERAVGKRREGTQEVAPRFRRSLPVRFGRDRPVLAGKTIDLSETGMFVQTDQPMAEGALVGVSIDLEYGKVPLRANVAWLRPPDALGGPPGMGLALLSPPALYVSYVRALD